MAGAAPGALWANGREIEVLNAGVPGYGTDQSYQLFALRLRSLAPDLVLFCLYLNDADDNIRQPLFDIDRGSLVPLDARKTSLDLAGRFSAACRRLFRRTRLYDLLQSRLNGRDPFGLSSVAGLRRAPALVARKITLEMQGLMRMARSDGFALLVLAMPHHGLRDGYIWWPRSRPWASGAAMSAVNRRGATHQASSSGATRIRLAMAIVCSRKSSTGCWWAASSEATSDSAGQLRVLLVGRQGDNRPIDLGRDVMAVKFAPHRALVARAAAIVHQSGAGTLHQALASGRPKLVVPHAHDQPDNAHRAQQIGVARTLYLRRYTVDALVRELSQLLDDPAYADRAAETATVVRAEDAVPTACDAIDALMRG